jgi:hypothetical protein
MVWAFSAAVGSPRHWWLRFLTAGMFGGHTQRQTRAPNLFIEARRAVRRRWHRPARSAVEGVVFMDLRYPIGPFQWPGEASAEQLRRFTDELAEAPLRLRAAVAGLSDTQLDTPHRPGGWTVRQVVHHLPDSHLNAYTRFRLALTEDQPTIKPYDQARWAELSDARTAPVVLSLTLLESLHARWVLLLRSMSAADFARSIQHPELGVVKLDRYLAMYAWHSRHHVAHITSLRDRQGWNVPQ